MSPVESALLYVERSVLAGGRPQMEAVHVVFSSHPDIVEMEQASRRGWKRPK